MSTKKLIADGAISIKPVELLAAAAAVVLIGKTGVIPETRQVSLKSDNKTACGAANSGQHTVQS